MTADTQSPHMLFTEMKDRPYSFFLDSAAGSSNLCVNSFMGSDPFLIFKSKHDLITLEWADGRKENIRSNPFSVLKELFGRFSKDRTEEMMPFASGGVGYFAYDMKDFIETLPDIAKDDIGIPDCIIGFYDKVTRCGASVSRDSRQPEKMGKPSYSGLRSNFSKTEYMKTVEKAKEYIRKGDIYQVNLSQRFEADLNMEPYDLYLRLRETSPAPFSSYLNFGDVTVISSSPERFLMKKGPYVETRPIKGTRPRSADPLMDEFNERELLASYKDRAEHIMIVDLERNDLGRICEYGSVRPAEFITLEKYSTVFHLVSTVSGRLKEGIGPIDCLLSAFPGGSITGAPKIRSMQIIEELEPVKRSLYTGAIGYISFDGDMDTSIAIRTMIVKGGKIYFQVGGGIVFDSDPEKEYYETLDKAKGIMDALEIESSLISRR
ncbi:MAG: aminodeoxychorismate synthase component I [Candidatus Omnitrophica bacterium]|nr:aminodeoxychorismate synthase component I [Candidatus Omnitrophota bacterium]